MILRDRLNKVVQLLDEHPDFRPKTESKALLNALSKLEKDIETMVSTKTRERESRLRLLKLTDLPDASIKEELERLSLADLEKLHLEHGGKKSTAKTEMSKRSNYTKAMVKRVVQLRKELA